MLKKFPTYLKANDIPYIIYPVSETKINVFFGSALCIDVIRNINKKRLNEYSDEEDFILGTMLGYGMLHQCERYLKKKAGDSDLQEIIG